MFNLSLVRVRTALVIGVALDVELERAIVTRPRQSSHGRAREPKRTIEGIEMFGRLGLQSQPWAAAQRCALPMRVGSRFIFMCQSSEARASLNPHCSAETAHPARHAHLPALHLPWYEHSFGHERMAQS